MGDVHPCSYTHSIETMQFLGRSVENNYKTFHKERKLKSKLSAVTSASILTHCKAYLMHEKLHFNNM